MTTTGAAEVLLDGVGVAELELQAAARRARPATAATFAVRRAEEDRSTLGLSFTYRNAVYIGAQIIGADRRSVNRYTSRIGNDWTPRPDPASGVVPAAVEDVPVGWLANSGLSAWIAAVLLWPTVAMLPGYLTVGALQPRRARPERWALAPLVSIAIAFVPAIWIDWLHPGWGLATAGAALLLTTTGALVVLRRRGLSTAAMPPPSSGSLAWLVGLMTTTVVVASAVVFRSAGGLATVVPNDDGAGHGSFVARLLLTGSVNPLTVTTIDPAAVHASGSYYPLGLHVVAALVAKFSSVPASLVVAGLLAGAVWGPLAMFTLARRFVAFPVAIATAGLLALATPWFPYGQMAWGGWPLIVAVALVPAAVLAASDVRTLPDLPVLVLTLAGLFAVHITEFAVAGLITGLSLLFDKTPSRMRLWRAGLLLLGAFSALVILSPFARGIGHADPGGLVDATKLGALKALRTLIQIPYFGFQPPGTGLGFALTVWSLVALGLVGFGTRWLWRNTAVRGLVTATWLFFGLAYAAYVGHLGFLTKPWYGSGNRILAQATTLAVLPLAAALVRITNVVHRHHKRNAMLALVFTAIGVGAMLIVRTAQTGDAAFARAMVTNDQVAAFRWLAAHSKPGERVLNDPRDGSVWMFQATGGALNPLFGLKQDWATDPAWIGRTYLQAQVAYAATDQLVRAEAAAWHVRYVLVDPAVIPGGKPALKVAAIESAPGLREVFSSGPVRVYEVPN